MLPRENRKLCCREDLTDRGWDDCQWYSRYGLFSKDWPVDTCYAGCPDSKVRVAMDESLSSCSQGAAARCCSPRYSTVTKRASAPNAEFDTLLGWFLGDPRCTTDESSQDYAYEKTLIGNIQTLIYGSPDTTKTTIWDTRIGSSYPNLKYASLVKWANSDPSAALLGSTRLPQAILCGLAAYNEQIGGTGLDCACTATTCGTDTGDTGGIDRRMIQDWSNITSLDLHESELFERGLLRKRAGEDYRTIRTISALTGLPVIVVVTRMAVSVHFAPHTMFDVEHSLMNYSIPQLGTGWTKITFGRRLSTSLRMFAAMFK